MFSGGSVPRSKFGGLALLLLPALSPIFAATDPLFPSYTAAGIVNAATQTAEALAPNTIASLYGANLAYSTEAVTSASGSVLPNNLGGVTVYVNGTPAHLFFVSPGQINFLIPYEMVAGPVTITVLHNSLAGPSIKVMLNSTSPGLFALPGSNGGPSTALAVHLSGALISTDAPAKPGEIIVIYMVGLGRVSPDTTSGRLAVSAAAILALSQLQVSLSGAAAPSSNVLYAGLAPGFAGLYQINLRLPDTLPPNPTLVITASGQTSQTQVQLPAVASAPPVVSNLR